LSDRSSDLIDEVDEAGISRAGYMEAMPAGGQLADFWPSSSAPLYASKHNPFPLFTDIRDNPARLANIKPYTDMAGDLNSPDAPRFVFITPDQCNDYRPASPTAGRPARALRRGPACSRRPLSAGPEPCRVR